MVIAGLFLVMQFITGTNRYQTYFSIFDQQALSDNAIRLMLILSSLFVLAVRYPHIVDKKVV